ncbi:MAG: hypothetical protein LBF27_25850 [Sphingobacterium sp.]|jgi:hypothetical protein|nr:hypothetical protein [Sphingobacterium sp.]
MGTVVNLTTPLSPIGGVDLDSLVVRENYTSTDGGVTLDLTGYARDYVRAGHVIIRTGTVGDYVYKPMPLNGAGNAYGTLPASHEYYGHAVQSVTSKYPNTGVTYHAKINPLVVNADAGYFDMSGILSALKTALTHVIYKGDND